MTRTLSPPAYWALSSRGFSPVHSLLRVQGARLVADPRYVERSLHPHVESSRLAALPNPDPTAVSGQGAQDFHPGVLLMILTYSLHSGSASHTHTP